MAHLTTVPTFIFPQLNKDGILTESPIQVSYYNGIVELKKVDDTDSYILIDTDKVKALFKEILKHMPEAQRHLNKK